MTNVTSPNEQLRDIICDGVVHHLIYLEEALSLSRFANQIRAPHYDELFLGLAGMAIRTFILQAAKLFERPSARHRIRSIPAAIKVLRDHGDNLSIPRRAHLIKVLSRLGVSTQQVKNLDDKYLTAFVADFFAMQISKDRTEGVNNANTIELIKEIRDRVVAHPESIHITELPHPTFLQIDQLIVFAKTFVCAVGAGYANGFYEDDDGNYCATARANMATAQLRRLLKRTRVLTA